MKVKEIINGCSEWKPSADYDIEKPIVSVLLPTFCRAKSVQFERVVSSVLNQDYKKLELNIIDDASTDGTAELIDYFMKSDCRVSCIRHRYNVGMSVIGEYKGVIMARKRYCLCF